MGVCGTNYKKNNKRVMPQIYIDRKDEQVYNNKTLKENEAVIPGNATYIPDEKLKIILNQKEKSICKIIKNGKPIGTGFLCSITCQYKKRIALITANNVLGVEDIQIGNEIKITFNDSNEKIKIIKIDNSRRIYSSEIDDITIIEIINSDNLKNNIILEIDEDIYNK